MVQYVDISQEITFRCSYNLSNLVSGGFATVHPGNSLTVNAVEGAPLEDFSIEVFQFFQVYSRAMLIRRLHRLFVQTLLRPLEFSVALVQTRIRWRHGSKLRFTRHCRPHSSNLDLPRPLTPPQSKLLLRMVYETDKKGNKITRARRSRPAFRR